MSAKHCKSRFEAARFALRRGVGRARTAERITVLSTADSPSPARHRFGPALFAAALAATAALQACAPQRPTHTPLPVYAIDQAGAAHTCTVSPLAPAMSAGKNSSATMALSNDGGWCAVSTHQDGPAPFTAGLLTTRPEHGKVFVHSVGDETRLDYTPEAGYGGNDTFAVTLIPGDETVQVTATVAAPPAPPAAAVPPPAKPPVKKSPRRLLKKVVPRSTQ